jgi:hypothetical protein
MGLITETGRSVRFQHSVIQAYLGSRFLGAVLHGGLPDDLRVLQVEWDLRVREYAAHGQGAPGVTAPPETFARQQEVLPAPLQDTDHIAEALDHGGRELLMAFALHSRSPGGACTCHHRDGADWPFPCPVVLMRRLLKERAEHILGDAVLAEKVRERRGRELRRRLRLDERGSPRARAMELYGAAVEIDSVDAAPTQQQLIAEIERNWQRLSRGEDEARLREAKIALVKQCGQAARRVAAVGGGDPGYEPLFHLGVSEPDYRVRAAIVQETGAGETAAFRALYRELSGPVPVIEIRRPPEPQQPPGALNRPDGDPRERRALHHKDEEERSRAEDRTTEEEGLFEWQAWHRNAMRAWLLPMLVQSARLRRHLGSPRDDLEKWVDLAVEDAPARQRSAAPGSRAALGTSLAQGFKYAANRRPDPETDKEAREFLMKQAQELLRRSTFWYTRLTLLQALTLWELPDDVTEDQPMRGHRSNPEGKIDEWLALDRHQQEHPLVKAAGRLAVRALQTRRPERFLWIDEVGAAGQIGTEVGRPGEQRAHNLWIPPSTGWSTLDPQAQQLLADVLLLLGLGERGYRPKDLFRVRNRDLHERARLPSCLSRDRSRLDPLRPMARACEPGTNCTDECRLKMCPYPNKVEHLRLEFSEVFCMRQRELLMSLRWRDWCYLRFRREARWQRGVPVANMRRFWADMGDRARDAGRDEDSAGSGRIRR